ncbi:penicillin acylase family protein [Aquimarina spongiae]|uniref:Acyl-homoserine-lactone acylase n=1 Tax=Aquimarina spongiae TaxID=570521 RepID=A0A1M6I4Q4_9FLAO|nr:penicillin acylase family protein [Aquimarina spongiae]SHJ29456.1 acyl-homoserine-lactone acylase [Aquimarina spongiae]
MKKLFILLTLPFLISNTSTSNYENEILWDTWGIPHIYADNDANLYKMMGWAQMHNHADLMLKLYGEARAKSSEYWGVDSKRDVLLHQLGLLEASEKTFESMEEEDKKIIASFVEGINAYAEKNANSIDEKYKAVLPVQSVDIIYHATRVMYMEFLINRNLRTVQQWSPGSNAWAVNGKKTASGNSMLLANPHLPWNDFWLFFEAHLITANNNLYGATLVGLPTLGIAFNENLGWTHTVNTLDNVDFYELSIKNDTYLIDGQYKKFEIDSMPILVKTDASLKKEMVIKKQSDFGMIVRESGDKAIAIRWPNMDGKLNAIGQWRAMGQASNLEEFKAAIDKNALPLFNVIYSDKNDNILYHFGGHVPEKNGDWEKWQGILPTSSSKDIWKGYYPASKLPSYINPDSGWIQNANDPPFTSTFPAKITPDQYASHIAPNSMYFRPQRSAKLIMDANNLTLDQFITLKHDTKSELALRIQDELKSLKQQTKDSLTLAALDVLTNWDASFDASSTGAVLFMNLIRNIGTGGYFEKPWSYKDPINSPDGFADNDKMLAAIQKTAKQQMDKIGSLTPSFGDIFRLKVGSYEYPGNGGPGQIGLFRTMHYVPGKNGKFYPYHGDSYVCATEFGKQVKAKALMSYGNATQKGNAHVGDQLQLFSEKKLRDVWYTRVEQEKHLERIEKLSEM